MPKSREKEERVLNPKTLEHVERKTLSPKEVAQILGVSPVHVIRMVDQNELTGVRLGRRVLVSKLSVEGLLNGTPTLR